MVGNGQMRELIAGRAGEQCLWRKAAIGEPGVSVQIGKHGKGFEKTLEVRGGKGKPAVPTSKPLAPLKVD